jgi:hypothetical protein
VRRRLAGTATEGKQRIDDQTELAARGGRGGEQGEGQRGNEGDREEREVAGREGRGLGLRCRAAAAGDVFGI